jgi:uncharacterized protein YabE (DUF348 family)
MRLLLQRSNIVWIAAITIAVILCASMLVLIYGQAEAKTEPKGRLITIYDRGQEKVLLSEAETIGDALKDADVLIDDRDAVEPSVAEKLVASEYQINIYRARPVTVIDGATRQKVMTPYQTAEQIVQDTGIVLYREDTTSIQRSDDLLAGGAGLELRIKRATIFTFTLYGTTSEARTQAKTVGDMLKEKNIILAANDRASVPLSTPITAGTAVQVWREGKQTVTVEESVGFETQQIRDANRDDGYRVIETPGIEGKRNATYEIEIRDGKEVARTEIASLVTVQPSKQIEIIGSKPKIMPYTGGGSKSQWLAASNIPTESWGYADFMVGKESGWNPNAVNRSSGACGLAQALPCSKVPGNPYDPTNSLNWMNGYVNGRYGGWEGAYSFWTKNRWY